MIFWLGFLGCQPAPVELIQPPISLQLVLHSEPIPRSQPLPCADDDLINCGLLHAGVIFERTRNWVWLANTLEANQVKTDLQLAPELAEVWLGDYSNVDFEALGPSSQTEFDLVLDEAQALSQRLMDSDLLRLGLHIHNIRSDGSSGFGELRYPSTGPSPCEESPDNPMHEPPAEALYKNLDWSVRALQRYAEAYQTEVLSFSGHFPRSMANKTELVVNPESLFGTQVYDRFKPQHLSSAYAECYLQIADHPSFWAWPSDGESALGIGSGPIIQPALRATGSMNDHLGTPSDAALGANLRRLIQLMMAHRYAQLSGLEPLGWGMGIHSHLFHLYSGEPNPWHEAARENQAVDGNSYREELVQLLDFVNIYTEEGWRGLDVAQPIFKWSWRFSEVESIAEAQSLWEAHDRLGLEMLESALKESHLRDFKRTDAYDSFLFEQCEMRWRWGGEQRGFHCDGQRHWIELFVPWEPICMAHSADLMANIDDLEWSYGEECHAGRWIYPQGTLFKWLAASAN